MQQCRRNFKKVTKMSMITNDWLDEIQGEFKKP
jgi:hypothetical protein